MNKQILKRAILIGLFVLPFIPFLVNSSLFFPFITTKAFTFRFIVEIVFGIWIMLALIAPEYRPKRSTIFWALAIFLLVIGLADLFGAAPVKSFWSNFERMEGYITLLHLGALFLVMGSVFREVDWKRWWNTSLAASALMIVYCLLQLAGAAEIHQGGARVDGTLGNAEYLALYLLIHIFIALRYFLRSKGGLKWTYGVLLVSQVAILYFTATRGAILALVGGAFVIAFLNLWNKENSKARKLSFYSVGIIIALVIGFFFARNTSFVKQNPVLSRLASISLAEWKTEGRSYVWPMALKGIAERPILGWGQDNFNYIFAEHYSAQMFHLEPWFDRAHNIFLDWGVAGGLLGLGTYLSLYVVLLMYIWKRGEAMSFVEKSVLTGLLAAYFFNNFFVFDNLTSYVLFIALLSEVHGRIARPFWRSENPVSTERAMMFGLPVLVATICILYLVNVRPLLANVYLIDALIGTQGGLGGNSLAIDDFQKAYYESRLGRSEVVEWISSTAPTILSDNKVPLEKRNTYFTFANNAVEKTTQDLPNDPRYELIAGIFDTTTGLLDNAVAHLNKAESIMPQKQQILFNLGQALYYKKDYLTALDTFKRAYDLAPDNEDAKNLYDAALKQIPH